MLFNSYPFLLVFLPLALIGFHGLSRLGPRFAGGWLAFASLAFYSYWNIHFLALLLASIAFNYAVSRLIHAAAKRPALQSALLSLGIAADVGALVYYKYLFSLLGFLRAHTGIDIPFANVVLPLGISFFTFTQIGYLVDIKQGMAKDRDLLDYVLFVTFFPHLIAGPILHNREMMPQFANPRTYRFSSIDFAVGLTIFAIGLAKKTIIADDMAPGATEAFAFAATAGTARAWHGALSYSMQIYFDFSGYSDMAIGLARMFNVRFPLNFNSPYKATSVVDYWLRWHMTLTRFVTMYVFNPMALWVTRRRMERNLDATRRANATLGGFLALVFMPTMITMGLIGIWHGAGLQFLVFGLLHGVYIVVNHATSVFFPRRARSAGPPSSGAVALHGAKVFATYLAVVVAFIFFRADSIQAAFDMLAGMLGLHAGSPTPAPAFREFLKLAVLYGVVWFLPNTQQIMSAYEPALGKVTAHSMTWLRWRPGPVGGLAVGALLACAVLSITGVAEFLYFQF
jgi:D-alanyl-lipoteichoic acid acyltransferase DltB (MBOAT superfamily)